MTRINLVPRASHLTIRFLLVAGGGKMRDPGNKVGQGANWGHSMLLTTWPAPTSLDSSVASQEHCIGIILQRSWVQIPFMPEFFQALILQLLKLCA